MVMLSCEQLEERMAALHRASLDLVRDISLESLLERIASEACRQTNAKYAAVGVLGENGDLSHFVPVGMSKGEISKMAHPPQGVGLLGDLMNSKKIVRVSNVAVDPRSAGFPEHHPIMTSFLGVPILLGEQQLGQIYITNKADDQDFTEADEQVIEMLAAYAAIAISNANLYKELSHRNENLLQLNDLASSLVTSSDMDQILDKGLGYILENFGLEVVEVFLGQDDRKLFSLVKHNGSAIPALGGKSRFWIGEGLVGKTAASAESQRIQLPYRVNGHDLSEAVRKGSLGQIICLPMTGRQGVLGVLCVAIGGNKPLALVEEQYLSAITSWIAMAIENVHLNMQQRRLAVLEERERIGMDLHDGVIQSIYGVGLILEHARLLMADDTDKAYKRIEQAIEDLNSTIRDIRSYILDLRPHQLHDENLMRGVRRLVSEFRANTLVEVSLQGPSDGLADLPDVQAMALFHICQEALANIAKHAHASHVHVNLWTTADRALLEVRDDGRGFNLDQVQQTLGHGLSNMSTRARNVGGDMDLSTEPGEGSTVLAWVPFLKES